MESIDGSTQEVILVALRSVALLELLARAARTGVVATHTRKFVFGSLLLAFARCLAALSLLAADGRC